MINVSAARRLAMPACARYLFNLTPPSSFDGSLLLAGLFLIDFRGFCSDASVFFKGFSFFKRELSTFGEASFRDSFFLFDGSLLRSLRVSLLLTGFFTMQSYEEK